MWALLCVFAMSLICHLRADFQPKFFDTQDGLRLTLFNAAFRVCISGSLWALPARDARQDLQGEEGFKNSGQKGTSCL